MISFTQATIKAVTQKYKTRLEKNIENLRRNEKKIILETEKKRAFDQARGEFSDTKNLNFEEKIALLEEIRKHIKTEKEHTEFNNFQSGIESSQPKEQDNEIEQRRLLKLRQEKEHVDRIQRLKNQKSKKEIQSEFPFEKMR